MIVDFVRKLVIKKEKHQKQILSLLEEEYMVIINTIGILVTFFLMKIFFK